ncbi:MAG: PQQ-binding-like beta-propeller repeat protein [Methanotrichaceae archaeon]|nr:PQQ-binding-like beta-propeller repeat protein [Methanotrichaceae archaeon]
MKAILILLSFIFLFGNVSASDWPQFQKDGFHSGVSPDQIPYHPLILWSADVQRVDATPIVSSGLVYVLAGNGSLSAFDKQSGGLVWLSRMDGWVFQTSTPASSGKAVFAATDSGILAAFIAQTGEELCNRSLTDKRFEAPLTYLDGRIYLGEGSAYGTGEKKYICLFENGTECWNLTTQTKGYMWCGACTSGEYLIFGQNDGKLLSLNRSRGEVADELNLNDSTRISFSRPNPGRIRASVAYAGDGIYTTSESSAQEGFAWKIGFDGKTGRFENRGWSAPVGFSTSTPAVVGDRVYLGVGEHGHPGALACLNDSSGEMIWSYPVDAGVKSSPAISIASKMPRILFTTSQVNGSVYCLEDRGAKAELLWKLDPPDNGYILGGVAISNGRIYFGTEGDQHYGKLYCLGDGAGVEGWPQFHSNAEHTGFSDSQAPLSNNFAWISRNIGAQPGSSVSVAEGKAFINCVNNLTCLDQQSGEVLWIFPFNASGDFAFGFTPVYSRERVFFISDRTYCLNASDGEKVWSYALPTGRFAVDASPGIADGRIVVSDWDGHHYYCLDEVTGKELWNFTVDGNAQSTPAIAGSRVVFAAWDWGLGGKIYCAHLGNGSEIWNISTENSPCGSAAIQDETVYMATYNFNGDGDLLALSLANGSVLWKAQVSPTDSTPALAGGRVYLCGGCQGFSELLTYCFAASSGELIWRTPAKERIGDWRCSPAYADGLLFAGRANFTEYGGIFALNASNGETAWSYPEGGSSPAVAGGMVFTIGQGRVYAFGNSRQEGGLE